MRSPLLANKHHQLSPRWFVIKPHFQTLLAPLTQVRNSCLCWLPQLEKGGEEANTCTHCWNYCWLSGCAETTPNGDFRMTEVAGPLFLGVRRLRSQSKPASPSALALLLALLLAHPLPHFLLCYPHIFHHCFFRQFWLLLRENLLQEQLVTLWDCSTMN